MNKLDVAQPKVFLNKTDSLLAWVCLSDMVELSHQGAVIISGNNDFQNVRRGKKQTRKLAQDLQDRIAPGARRYDRKPKHYEIEPLDIDERDAIDCLGTSIKTKIYKQLCAIAWHNTYADPQSDISFWRPRTDEDDFDKNMIIGQIPNIGVSNEIPFAELRRIDSLIPGPNASRIQL